MVKFVDKSIVFEEIPDRVTLALSISNCQNNCPGCHSSFLSKNIGTILTQEHIMAELAQDLNYCNCILFLGEGKDLDELIKLNYFIKEKFNIETAIYSGRDSVEDKLFDAFDFVKIGSYKANLGGLSNPNTNQRLYYHKKDITSKFWVKKME